MRSLVIVEGLPKSGKSSVREHLVAELGGMGFGESDFPHPIDIGWPADRRAAILGCRLATYPFDQWERLVNSLQPDDRPVVLEARLCQNAACFALAAGAPFDEAAAISERLVSIVERAAPLIIYLRPADQAGHVRQVLDHFDPVSRAYLADLFGELPYAASRGLIGEAAFIETVGAWTVVIEATMRRVAEAPGCTLVTIDDPAEDWTQTNRIAIAACRV